jgi:hypothetical protein
MLHRKLGNTGIAVSKIALGTMYFGSETSEEDAFAILDTFVEAGGNLITPLMCMLLAPRNRSSGAGSPRGLVTSPTRLSLPARGVSVVARTSMQLDCRGATPSSAERVPRPLGR